MQRYGIKNNNFIYTYLNQIRKEFITKKSTQIEDFIYDVFQKNINPIVPNFEERFSYIELFQNLKKSKLKFNVKDIIEKYYMRYVDSLDALRDFYKFENCFKQEYSDYVKSENFKDKLLELIKTEIEFTNGEDLDYLSDDIKDIEKRYTISLSEQQYLAEVKYSEYEEELDQMVENELDNYDLYNEFDIDKISEDLQIERLFDSLVI